MEYIIIWIIFFLLISLAIGILKRLTKRKPKKPKPFLTEAEEIGIIGEQIVESTLKALNDDSAIILRNLYLPKKDNTTTEIDLIYINSSGIFVIESKNYTGWIYGKESDHYWTVAINRYNKNKLYNPIRQNSNHIKSLKRVLNKNYAIYNLVVFSGNCQIKKAEIRSKNIYVIKNNFLQDIIHAIGEENKTTITPEEILTIKNKLIPYTNATEEIKQNHKERIREMRK